MKKSNIGRQNYFRGNATEVRVEDHTRDKKVKKKESKNEEACFRGQRDLNDRKTGETHKKTTKKKERQKQVFLFRFL